MVGVNDLCTRNCVAVQPSHFRMPLRFASRLSSTDLIYALLRRNINMLPSRLSPRFVAAETESGKILKNEGKRSGATFRGSKRRNSASHGFHGLCNFVHSPLPSRTNRARLSREAEKSYSARVWKHELRCRIETKRNFYDFLQFIHMVNT